jgi:hypothetical protein
MYLVQMLLPRSGIQGQPFPGRDFDRLKEELAARFDGVAAYPDPMHEAEALTTAHSGDGRQAEPSPHPNAAC